MKRFETTIPNGFQFTDKKWYSPMRGRVCNTGEAIEDMACVAFGYIATEDRSASYDKCGDYHTIDGIEISCKSNGFSLTQKLTSDESTTEARDEIIKRFMETSGSSYYDYCVIVDDKLIVYEMDKSEFPKFLQATTKMARLSGKTTYKVRHKLSATKTIAWLENQLG